MSDTTKHRDEAALKSTGSYLDEVFNPDPRPPRLSSGIRELDRLTGGLTRGKMTVVGGLRGTGKSTLAMDIIAHGAARWTERKQLVLALGGRAEEAEAMLQAACQRPRATTVIRSANTPTAEEVVTMAKAFAKEHDGIDVLVIDSWENMNHLSPLQRAEARDEDEWDDADRDYYVGDDEGEKTEEQLEEEAQDGSEPIICSLARQLDCVVLITTRIRKVQHPPLPRMTDITCDRLNWNAGIVLFTHHPNATATEEAPGRYEVAELVVDKSQESPIGIVPILWDRHERRYV